MPDTKYLPFFVFLLLILCAPQAYGNSCASREYGDMRHCEAEAASQLEALFADYGFYEQNDGDYEGSFPYAGWAAIEGDEGIVHLRSFSAQCHDYRFGCAKHSSSIRLSGLPYLESVDFKYNNVTDLDLSNNPRLKEIALANYYDEGGLHSFNVAGSPNIEIISIGLGKGSSLSTLDVSGLAALRELIIIGDGFGETKDNAFVSLDLHNNAALESLYIKKTNITDLQLGHKPRLKKLGLTDNDSLERIDIGGCPALEHFAVGGAKIGALDFSGNPELKTLQMSSVYSFESLDLSANAKLKELSAPWGLRSVKMGNSPDLKVLDLTHRHGIESLSGLEVSGLSGLEKLLLAVDKNIQDYNPDGSPPNLSKNIALKELDLTGCGLATLDLKRNTALKKLYIGGNNLQKLDLSANTELEFLHVGKNSLTNLDLRKNKNLVELLLSDNQFGKIDLSGQARLEKLNIKNAGMASLAVPKGEPLKELVLDNSPVRKLDVRGAAGLDSLNIKNNGLEEIIFGGNDNITQILLGGNKLKKIKLSGTPNLTRLELDNNQLAVIDLNAVPALASLNLGGNRLSKINLAATPRLKELNVSNNMLASLDLSHNAALASLGVAGNMLHELDLGANPHITGINAGGNRLEALDVTKHKHLYYLNVPNNRLRKLDLCNNNNLHLAHLADNRLESVRHPDGVHINAYIDLHGNRLALSALYPFSLLYSQARLGEQRNALFDYMPLKNGCGIDFAAESSFTGQPTVFTLVDENGVEQPEAGHFNRDRNFFYITATGRYRIKMQNPAIIAEYGESPYEQANAAPPHRRIEGPATVYTGIIECY